MEPTRAVIILSALAHEGRLGVFRRLVNAGEAGMAAGDLARAADMLPNTLSSNLTILSHAGLVTSQRAGRSIIYSANYEQMRELLAYLIEDCCEGNPEICAPLADITARACC